MSGIDYTKIERPSEPSNESVDPEQWCRVLAWEEARADKLQAENDRLKEFAQLMAIHEGYPQIQKAACKALRGPEPMEEKR